MNICHIWDADYPWDVRVEKVSRSLTHKGHAVHLVARNRDGNDAEEALPEATVHRLRPLPFGKGLDSLTSFPAFFNPRWTWRIAEVCRRTRADVILVRDLPLAPAAIRVGRKMGLPVALDMAENYPAMIRAIWDAGRQKPHDMLVRNPRFVAAVERWVLSRIDHVFVVIEENMERLVQLGYPSDRVSVVLNTPPRSRLLTPPRKHRGQSFKLFYLGLLEAPRGVAELITAVGLARRAGVEVELDLVGGGREAPDFRKLAQNLGLIPSGVRFHGFLAHPEAIERMRHADVGVVPHYANESWNTTIPNKLFDYMAAGLPVLASDVKPVARIVEETGAGVIYADRDPEDAARALGELRDPAIRSGYAEAGLTAVAERYNWERDADVMATALERLVTPSEPALHRR